jgi:hypothetical protein
MTIEQRRVREIARIEAYHRGPAMKYEDVARHCEGYRPRFVAEQCELAGFPVWTSVPDEVLLQP